MSHWIYGSNGSICWLRFNTGARHFCICLEPAVADIGNLRGKSRSHSFLSWNYSPRAHLGRCTSRSATRAKSSKNVTAECDRRSHQRDSRSKLQFERMNGLQAHLKDGLKIYRRSIVISVKPRADKLWTSESSSERNACELRAEGQTAPWKNLTPIETKAENAGEEKAGFNEMVLIATVIRYDMYATLRSLLCPYLVGLRAGPEKLGKLTGREPEEWRFEPVWPIEGGCRCWWRAGRLVREWWENGENRETAGKWARLSHTRTPRSCKLIVDRYCAFVAHG